MKQIPREGQVRPLRPTRCAWSLYCTAVHFGWRCLDSCALALQKPVCATTQVQSLWRALCLPWHTPQRLRHAMLCCARMAGVPGHGHHLAPHYGACACQPPDVRGRRHTGPAGGAAEVQPLTGYCGEGAPNWAQACLGGTGCERRPACAHARQCYHFAQCVQPMQHVCVFVGEKCFALSTHLPYADANRAIKAWTAAPVHTLPGGLCVMFCSPSTAQPC